MKSPFFDARLLRRLWEISWPTIVYAILETTVGLADIYFSGFLGSDAVAAVGFSRQIFLVLMIGTLAITTGTITLVAQYFGAGRCDMASAAATQSLRLAVISGLILGVIGAALASPSLLLLGAEGDVLIQGSAYLRILMGGVVFLMINYSVNAVFRALGDTKTPLKITSVINVLNIGLDYVFVFGLSFIPALGVKGIALGTIMARALGAAWALAILSLPSREVRLIWDLPAQKDLITRLLSIGLPSGFSGFFRNGARIVFFAILASTSAGTAAVAVASIGFQVRMLAIMPALAIQAAVSALVGQSIGANNLEEAEGYGWTSIKFCVLIFGFLSLLLFLFPARIVRLFTDVPEVISLANAAMRFIALEQFCNCVSIVASGALSGAGDTKPPMRYTIFSQWFLMLPLALWFSYQPSMNIWGVWLAWGMAPAVQLLLTVLRFTSGEWKSIKAAI
ncbi:MAG: MATE family efflux transporter [Candidatus Omnitrophota bacterium]